MRSTSTLLLLTGLAALTGCPRGPDGETGDTGDTDSGDEYEEGCHIVDGGDGYLYLTDALTVADPGSTIELCEGEITEELVIDKAITLVGAGTGVTTLVPAANRHALTIAAGGDVTVSALSIRSTRSGFKVETGGILTVSDVSFDELGNYAVESLGGTVVVSDVVVTQAGWGGFLADGGTMSVADSTIDRPMSFGVFADNGAVVDVSTTTVDGAVYANEEQYLFEADGAAVWAVDGSTLSLAGNTFSNSAVAGVQAENATVTLDGDEITGGFVGALFRNVEISIANAALDGYDQYGIYAIDTPDLGITDTAVTTDPDVSARPTMNADGSIGVLAIDSGVTITGGEVSGNNGAGVYLAPTTSGTVEIGLTMDGTLVSDNGRFGVVVYDGVMDMTDVDVVGTRNHDATCVTDSGYACNMGAAAWQSELTWTGGSVTDNETFGLTTLLATADVTGVTISRNDEFGLFAQQSSLNLEDALFDEGRTYGMYLYDTTAFVTNTTFSNAADTYYYEYEDSTTGAIEGRDVFYNARDVYAYQSELIVSESTFVDGEQGLLVSAGELTVIDSSISGYNDDALYAATDGILTAERVTLSDIGATAFYCSYGTLNLANVTVSDINERLSRTDYYTDGVFVQTYESAYPSWGSYGYFCSFNAEDVSMTQVRGQPFVCNNCGLDLDGFSLTDTGANAYSNYGAIHLTYYWSDFDGDGLCDECSPEVSMNDVTLTGLRINDGIRIVGYIDSATSLPRTGIIDLNNLSIGLPDIDDDSLSGVASSGIVLNTLEDVSITGFDMAETGSSGIVLTNVGAATITGASGTFGGLIDNAGYYGVSATDSDLTMSGVTVLDPWASGFYLNGGTHTLNDDVVTNAGGWGMLCENDPGFDACNVDLDGASGETSNCDACIPD